MKKLDLANLIIDLKMSLSKNPAPVKRVGIFGSLVKGQVNDDSDIDIAVEFEQGESFEFFQFVKFCELCEALRVDISQIYGRKIDVVHVEEKEGSFLDEIRQEVVWL